MGGLDRIGTLGLMGRWAIRALLCVKIERETARCALRVCHELAAVQVPDAHGVRLVLQQPRAEWCVRRHTTRADRLHLHMMPAEKYAYSNHKCARERCAR